MKITEDNYVRQMQRGNEKALEYFIEHHGWIVKTLICSKMASYPEEQAECANDVFLAIWENADRYDKKRASFTTWAAAVTRYTILNYMRKIRNRAITEEYIEPLHIGMEDKNAQIYYFDEEAEFRELIRDLSEEDQDIFVKLFYEEMDYDQVSSELNLSKPVLYNRVSKNKKRLKKKMEKKITSEGSEAV